MRINFLTLVEGRIFVNILDKEFSKRKSSKNFQLICYGISKDFFEDFLKFSMIFPFLKDFLPIRGFSLSDIGSSTSNRR